MKILLANDDGISAKGLNVLAEALIKIADVVVIAPSQERSTTSHSLTLHKPLRIHELKPGFYHVNGTPADCVYLGLKKIYKDHKPDFVISGINRGANLGYDVHYSGTVAAAREAALMKIPSIAVSLCTKGSEINEMNFDTAASVALKIVDLAKKRTMPQGVFLNINVPDRPLSNINGFRFVRTGVRVYSDQVMENKDPRGKSYYWLGGRYIGHESIENTDCSVIEEGYVSITPLQIDSTEHRYLKQLQEQEWDMDVQVGL
ncbi:MAG: 5'/3'-nucleotidase SurE [Deltaproteobacteria bacterium]|nr:5'/3'-nucleotidase SurE [Deltaproteobacteria bacterium]